MATSRSLRPLARGLLQSTRTIASRRELSVLTRNVSLADQKPNRSSQSISSLNNVKFTPLGKVFCQTRLLLQRRYASNSASELKQTPLYDLHTNLGAKMGPFASYSMPLEYPDQSHPTSHKWTREHASLFDVSHMVQHKMSGELAEEFLMTLTPSSLDTLPKHNSTLSCLLSSEGGIVDDTVITRIGRDSFYFVTNAGCRENDLKYLQDQMNTFLASKSAGQEKLTWHVLDHHALVALQGPEAASVLQELIFEDKEDEDLDTSLDTLYFGTSRWLQLKIQEEDTGTTINTPSLLISRTGYTGEDGFEISIPPENGDSAPLAKSIAKALTADSAKVRWAGLAARDSLRLEAGMCLYGHDLNVDITPAMAALGWTVGKERRTDNPSPAFNGHKTINLQLTSPKSMTSRRVGLIIQKGPAAREGAEIIDPEKEGDGKDGVIGKITSGCPSPSLEGQNIAMGMIKNGFHKRGTKVKVRVRKGLRDAEVVKMPFVESRFYRPA